MSAELLGRVLSEIWISLLAIVVLEGVALYTWQFREAPGALWQGFVQFCKGGLLVCALMSDSCPFGFWLDFWVGLGSGMGLLASYGWMRAIGLLSGYEQRQPKWILKVVHGGLLLSALVMLSNGWHGLCWAQVRSANLDDRAELRLLGWVIFGFICVMGVWTQGQNLLWVARTTGWRRTQAFMFMLPALVTWTGTMATFLPCPPWLEPHALSYLLAALLMGWAFHRWRAYSVLPLAQQMVLNGLMDGLVVFDERGVVVEMNASARSFFSQRGVVAGESMAELCQHLPQLGVLSGYPAESELWLEVDGQRRCYLISCSPLHRSEGVMLGRVLLIKDVTLEREQQKRIVEQQKTLAMLAERERLGRELHDGPGQMWSFLAAQTQAARLRIARGECGAADALLEELQQIVQESYIGLRESISGLQSNVRGGLVVALSEQLRWYRERCGMAAVLEVDSGWQGTELNEEGELHVLRILQEALSNVRKSAGAKSVRVSVGREAGRLKFVVNDDGCGFEPASVQVTSGHFGLQIMRERAVEIGGELRVYSAPGEGCRIELMV